MTQKLAYQDLETGNGVYAVQVEHGGQLIGDTFQTFKEGDFIVHFPTDLLAEDRREVFVESEFKKRFKTVGKKSFDWQTLQWKTV